MNRQRQRIRVRNRQKHSLRNVVLVGSFFLLMTLGSFIFFNVYKPGNATANQLEIIQVSDQDYIIDMSISAPKVKSNTLPDSHTLYFRKSKPLPEKTNSQND